MEFRMSQTCKLSNVFTFKRSHVQSSSPLDHPPIGLKQIANRIPVVTLDFEMRLGSLSARPALLLQLPDEALQEFTVARQSFDHGHGLPLATGLFDAEPSGDPVRHALVETRRASTALLGPPACGTHPARFGRVDGSSRILLGHAERIPELEFKIRNAELTLHLIYAIL